MTSAKAPLAETASQTAGPYVHIGCVPSFTGITAVYPADLGARATEDGAKGEQILIEGVLYDGTGTPVCDAMIESWQADANGVFPGAAGADPKVNGFCRVATDPETGRFAIRTVKPGGVVDASGTQHAPHLALWIVARGINIGLSTRIYFADAQNEDDPVLGQVADPARKQTLLAQPTGPGTYRFDIRLQGTDETVFLDI